MTYIQSCYAQNILGQNGQHTQTHASKLIQSTI